MDLYLLRHGIAVDRDHPQCPPDPDRPLTETGKRRTRAVARGMRALGLKPDAVRSSPFVRARQTAEIAMEELALPSDQARELKALIPAGEPDDVLTAVADVDADAVLCAGHAPNLDRVIARAAGAPRIFTSLKKAGLAVLQLSGPQPGRGDLVALYPARALRRLGGA